MPTLNLKALGVCAGGGHIQMRFSLGAQTREVTLERDEILSAIDDEELQAVAELLIRIYARGKSVQEVRTGLLAGVDVVVP